jgi:uncharacterized protein (TIGR01589 family)
MDADVDAGSRAWSDDVKTIGTRGDGLSVVDADGLKGGGDEAGLTTTTTDADVDAGSRAWSDDVKTIGTRGDGLRVVDADGLKGGGNEAGLTTTTRSDGCKSASEVPEMPRKRSRKRTGAVSAWRTRGARVSEADVRRTQRLLERCLRLYMSKEEIVRDLQVRANVEAAFTHLVWDRMERANPEFFEAYGVAVKFKDQVIRYNALVNRYKEQRKRDPKAFEAMEAEATRLAEEEEEREKAEAARCALEEEDEREKADAAKRTREEEEEREKARVATKEQRPPEMAAVCKQSTTTTQPFEFRAFLHRASTESLFKPVPELKEEVLRVLSIPEPKISSCDETSPKFGFNTPNFTLHEALGFGVPSSREARVD